MPFTSQTLVEKPWGHEKIWANCSNYVGKILYIKKGHKLSLQFHKEKEESIMILAGTMLLHHRLPGTDLYGPGPMQKTEMSEGDCFHIIPGLTHRFEAIDSDVTILEVSTTQLNDVVRLDDDYGRDKI